MADSTSQIPQVIAGTNADRRVNELFDAASPAMLYGRNAATTNALTWGFIGGRWGGTAVPNSTLTLTASGTHYLVAARSGGAVSSATSTTNWDDADGYVRLYKVVTGTTTIESFEDHRAGPLGSMGAGGEAGGGGGGVLALTDATTIAVDASGHSSFRVTLSGNRTLGNPTGLSDGQTLLFRIKQDGTGSRTLAYGSKYRFSGGSAPALSTGAAAIDVLTCQYDATDDTLVSVLTTGFA